MGEQLQANAHVLGSDNFLSGTSGLPAARVP